MINPITEEKLAQGETYAIERAERFGKAELGLGVDGAKYLADLGVAAQRRYGGRAVALQGPRGLGSPDVHS